MRHFSDGRIEEMLNLHAPDMIPMSGGTPCKQLSQAAFGASGLAGKDSKLFWAFRDMLAMIATVSSARDTLCFWLWENVCTR